MPLNTIKTISRKSSNNLLFVPYTSTFKMINTLKNRKCQRHLEKKKYSTNAFSLKKKPVKYHNNYQ